MAEVDKMNPLRKSLKKRDVFKYFVKKEGELKLVQVSFVAM